MSNEPEKVITPIRNAISEGEVDKQVTHYDKMNDDLRNSETVLNIGQEPTNGEEEKKEDDVSNQHLDPKKETVDAATKTKTDDAAATKTAKHEDKANENTTSDASDNDKEAHTQSRGIDPPEEGKINNTNSCNHHVPKDVTVPNNNSVLSLLDQASNMNPSAIANVPDGNEETEAFKSLLDSAAKTATNHFDKRFDENRDEARVVLIRWMLSLKRLRQIPTRLSKMAPRNHRLRGWDRCWSRSIPSLIRTRRSSIPSLIRTRKSSIPSLIRTRKSSFPVTTRKRKNSKPTSNRVSAAH